MGNTLIVSGANLVAASKSQVTRPTRLVGSKASG